MTRVKMIKGEEKIQTDPLTHKSTMTCYSLLHSYEWVAHAEQIKEIQQRVAFYLQPLSVLNSIFSKNYYNSWRRGSVTMTSDNDDCLLAVSLYV